jgi:hypothetical protein
LRLSPRPIIAEYAAPLHSTRTLGDLSSLSEYAEQPATVSTLSVS